MIVEAKPLWEAARRADSGVVVLHVGPAVGECAGTPDLAWSVDGGRVNFGAMPRSAQARFQAWDRQAEPLSDRDALDADTVVGKPETARRRTPMGCPGAFVVDLRIGNAGVVVDDGVDERVAEDLGAELGNSEF